MKTVTRAQRLAACRRNQAIYRKMPAHSARSYRILNAGFYLQLKRGIVRTEA